MLEAKYIVKHTGDCSIWRVHPLKNNSCKICDCGALREAIMSADERSDDLWDAWSQHLKAIEESYGEET